MNYQPQREQQKAPKARKTPPETSPNQVTNWMALLALFCLTEQYQCMTSMGTKMIGYTLKCTHNPNIAQEIYLFNMSGCLSIISLSLRSKGLMLPLHFPPMQKYQKAEARAMVMPQQLPRTVTQIRIGLSAQKQLTILAALSLASCFYEPLFQNILQRKRMEMKSKAAITTLPKSWWWLQEGETRVARIGEYRQVCLSQGEWQSEASRKTLQSTSTMFLKTPSWQLSPCEKRKIAMILMVSPMTAGFHIWSLIIIINIFKQQISFRNLMH